MSLADVNITLTDSTMMAAQTAQLDLIKVNQGQFF